MFSFNRETTFSVWAIPWTAWPATILGYFLLISTYSYDRYKMDEVAYCPKDIYEEEILQVYGIIDYFEIQVGTTGIAVKHIYLYENSVQ